MSEAPQLELLLRWLGPLRPGERSPDTGPLMVFLLALAPIAAGVRYGGFALPGPLLWSLRVALVLAALGLMVQWLILARFASDKRRFIARHSGWSGAMIAALVLFFGAGFIGGLKAQTAAATLIALAGAIHRGVRGMILSPSLHNRPSVTLVLGFAGLILMGTLVLWEAPRSLANGVEVSFVDALFTATSATCVTGLETLPTGTTYSHFGQTVVLLLIQLGGLGIMAMGTFLLLSTGARIGIGGRAMMGEVLNVDDLGRVSRLVTLILLSTFAFEALGALAFYPWFQDQHHGAFAALFHSVSAFCNAGIALQGDSFQSFAADPRFNSIAMVLIIAGGLGFLVLADAGRWFTARFKPRVRARHFTLHSRLVITSSAALIVFGALVFWWLERNGVLAERSTGQGALASLFQSVSARTAGFSTVDFGTQEGEGLSVATRFFLLCLMFIGASPGSTGGGLKTITFVVLLLAVVALFRNRRRVEIGGRCIPDDIVKKAAAIVLCYAVTIFVSVLVLLASDGSKFGLGPLMFESVSAVATVGYSVGVSNSPDLSTTGKLVLIVLMFAGRLGPLTLVLVTGSGRGEPPPVEYPEERVMIG